MGERAGYPSDLSDRQWALIDPFLQAWKAERPSPSGHEGRYDLRAIGNAIFYQNRTGCQWAYLPNDLPPCDAMTAPIAPFTICCAVRRERRPAGPRTRARLYSTPSQSGRRTTCRPVGLVKPVRPTRLARIR
jgi:transposase